MVAFLSSLLEWFVPEEIKVNISEYGKAKMTVGIGLVVGFIVLLQSLRSLFISVNLKVAAVIIIFSLFIMSGPLLLKFTKSKGLASNITIAGLFIVPFLVVMMRGGITSSIASYMSMVPICALMMSGLRSGITWGVISIGSLIFIFFLKRMGVEMPEQNLSPDGLQLYMLITYSVLVVFSTMLGSIFESISNGNFRRFTMAQGETQEINRQLKQALESVNAVMESVSDNDLSQRVAYQIEGELNNLKSSVNNAIEMLSKTVFEVASSSHEINNKADRLSESAKVLADGTSTQASSIEEISASMGEIEEVARQNNDNANQSKVLTEETLKIVKEGNNQMTELVINMNRIADAGQNINKIVKVIDEIAFQTNLLALNAAVEAARAGKYGKGFAVVAGEVRSLAGRSAEAAKNTTELITTSMQEIENGVSKVTITADFLAKITESVEKVNGLVVEIAAGSNNQKAGIEEITKGLNQVNEIVQQNTAISEKTAHASRELNEHSARLRSTMQQFVLSKKGVIPALEHTASVSGTPSLIG